MVLSCVVAANAAGATYSIDDTLGFPFGQQHRQATKRIKRGAEHPKNVSTGNENENGAGSARRFRWVA
jgi:hypothetical protein